MIKNAFTSHAAKAFVRGTLVGGTGTAIVFKMAGACTGIGIAASATFDCVGRIITYYWLV